jgi:hypothetical protein
MMLGKMRPTLMGCRCGRGKDEDAVEVEASAALPAGG